jgi:Holliday junction resolvase
MKEQQIQAKRIKQLEAEGYYVLKLSKTNKNGIPDILAIKEGEILFSEIKTPTGKLSEIQKYRIKELESYGFKTEVYNGE